MNRLTTLNSAEDNVKNKISKSEITSNSISKQILSLIEFSSQVNAESDAYKKLQNDLIIYFTRLLERRKDLDLLKSYFNHDKIKEFKVISKLEKNIMIYLPILIDYVYQQKEWKTEIQLQLLIKESFKKILILLFIYWDKTSLSLFSRLIKLDISELVKMEDEFIDAEKKLQDKEKDFIPSFLQKDIYSRTYRSIIEKTDEKYSSNWTKSREEFRKDVAIKEIEITSNWLYNLFLKTIELDLNLNLRLRKIANAFLSILWMIDVFKELWIIDLWYSLKNNKKFDNPYFKVFLDSVEKWDLDLKTLISSIREKDKKVFTQKQKEVINDDDFENTKLQWIDKNTWDNFSTNQKYTFFINKVLLLKEWEFRLSNSLMLSHPSKKTLIWNFCNNYWYSKENVDRKIEFFKSKKSFILSDFIRKELDKFVFLYEWWEFIVSKWAWNSSSKINKPDFLTDMIDKLREDKEISDKQDVKLTWEFYNLSAVNIWLQINFLFNDLSRWNIQLSKFRIWKILFKDTTKLYSAWEKSSDEESIIYLDNAIDACINVLNWKKLTKEQWEYIRLLQDIEILPLDLAKIKITDKDKIIKLIPWLKLVKTKIETLQEMKSISQNDMDLVSGIFSEIWLNNSLYDLRIWNSIWPEKDFWRVIVKLIKIYNWDFHKIWDLNRFRLIWKLWNHSENSIDKIIKQVIDLKKFSWVKNVSFENSAGHLLSNPEKKSAYRDIKANILLDSWNVVEVQIHFEEMIWVKAGDFSLNSNIKDMLEKSSSLLTSEEVDFLIKNYYELFWKYPSKNFILNISTLNEGQLSNVSLWDGKINCDMLYKITRSLPDTNTSKSKLIKLERILFNSQWSDVVLKNLESIWIDTKIKTDDLQNKKSKK